MRVCPHTQLPPRRLLVLCLGPARGPSRVCPQAASGAGTTPLSLGPSQQRSGPGCFAGLRVKSPSNQHFRPLLLELLHPATGNQQRLLVPWTNKQQWLLGMWISDQQLAAGAPTADCWLLIHSPSNQHWLRHVEAMGQADTGWLAFMRAIGPPQRTNQFPLRWAIGGARARSRRRRRVVQHLSSPRLPLLGARGAKARTGRVMQVGTVGHGRTG